MNPVRVLVTGAGSGVGQGIIKALRASSLPVRIISSDISPLNAGLFRSDEALLLPKVELEGSLAIIIERIKKNNINIILIGSEFDLNYFSKHKETIEKQTESVVVVSPLETVELANDKWLTSEFLRKNNLPYAQSYIPSGHDEALKIAADWGYPFILKSRTGTSSRHNHIVRDESELVFLAKKVPNPMLQKLIDAPGELGNEYTCSVFKSIHGDILGPFTARRTLRGGSSWIVEVACFETLLPLLRAIGKKLPLMGSLNVQLMMGTDGPVPFEFNARFSGTTAIRAHFGFNEPEMAIRNFLLKEELENPIIGEGLVFRYLEEVFVGKADADRAEEYFVQGIVRPWF